MKVFIPVSVGELIDKITILRLKRKHFTAEKIKHVEHELSVLVDIASDILPFSPELKKLEEDLQSVNAQLWNIENEKRRCEISKDFGPKFISLAREVYIENDRRAAIKLRINDLTKSDIVEQKEFR